jgi:hypothetical protein
VTPPPAARTKRGARISPGRPEVRGVLPKLDSLPDEALGPSPRHRVGDVEIHRASVGFGGVPNHTRRGLQDDEACKPQLPNLRHDPLWGDARITNREEWYVDQLQIQRGHGQCCVNMVCIGVAHPSRTPDLQQVAVGCDSRRGDRVTVTRDNRRLYH